MRLQLTAFLLFALVLPTAAPAAQFEVIDDIVVGDGGAGDELTFGTNATLAIPATLGTVAGSFRYDSVTGLVEYYNGSVAVSLSSATHAHSWADVVCVDCIDADDLADTVTLDAALIINSGANGRDLVINEDGRDADFRVESNAQTRMLFVDGGTNRVGISSSVPAALLGVQGGAVALSSITAQGGFFGQGANVSNVTAVDLSCTNCINWNEIGDGLGVAEIDETAIQRRVSGSCAALNAIRVVNQDGTVTCETVASVTVDTVTANEVTGAEDSSLSRSGSGTGASPYQLALNLDNANVWSAEQSFTGVSCADCVELGSETTGKYVANIAAATGITITGLGTIETLRPGTATDNAALTSNEANAIDASGPSTQSSTQYTQNANPSFTLYNWPSTQESYTGLVLKVYYQADASTALSDKDDYFIDYSVDNTPGACDSASWTNLVNGTDGPAAANNTLVTAALSNTQDLRRLCVRVRSAMQLVSDGAFNVYIEDVRTEGDYDSYSTQGATVTITNAGDTNASDDITIGSAAGGDLSGTYPNPSFAVSAVSGGSGGEISDNTVTAADLAPDAVGMGPDTYGKFIATVTAGAGIQAVFSGTEGSTVTLTNIGDLNPSDDLSIGAAAGGDLTGTYPNPTLVAASVDGTELADTISMDAATVFQSALDADGAVLFRQLNGTTGERHPFIFEDQDVGSGSQDGSSSLKVSRTGVIDTLSDGHSLLELQYSAADPGANKYYMAGRKTDNTPLWGVDLTDNGIFTTGALVIGVTGSTLGTYSGGARLTGTNLADLTDGGSTVLHTHTVGTATDVNCTDCVELGTETSGILPIGEGGTGASLADPNADRIFFWDDIAGAGAWLTVGTGLDITGTSLNNTGDTDGTGELNVGAAAGGDFTGTYPNPTVAADAVALTADTTGNYAGSTSEGGPAVDLVCSDCVHMPTESVGIYVASATAGSGIQVTFSGTEGSTATVTNTGDIDPGNDLNVGAAAGGDFTGTYPNPTVAADSVALGADTTGGYAASTSEGGPATDLACTDCVAASEITQGTAGQMFMTNATPDSAWVTMGGDATINGAGSLQLGANVVGDNELFDGGVWNISTAMNWTTSARDPAFSLQGGASDNLNYEYASLYSDATREGIFLWDGSWASCNSVVDEMCFKAEASNHLTLDAVLSVRFTPDGTGGTIVGGTAAASGSANNSLTLSDQIFFGTGGSYQVNSSGSAWLRASTLGTVTLGSADIITANHVRPLADNSGYVGTSTLRYNNIHATYMYGTFNAGPDLAEAYPASEPVEAGDVVMFDPSPSAETTVYDQSATRSGNRVGGRLISVAVKKTSIPYQKEAIGVVSTAPGVRMADPEDGSNPPIALKGRVPVKVSLENGPIRVGDPLTSASEPGYAMKAVEPGPTLGIALEDFDGEAGETGKILCFVDVAERNVIDAVNELLSWTDRLEAENRELEARIRNREEVKAELIRLQRRLNAFEAAERKKKGQLTWTER